LRCLLRAVRASGVGPAPPGHGAYGTSAGRNQPGPNREGERAHPQGQAAREAENYGTRWRPSRRI
jgi:hypothetical protein